MADPFNTPPKTETVYGGPTPGQGAGPAGASASGATAAQPARAAASSAEVASAAAWCRRIFILTVVNSVLPLMGIRLYFPSGLSSTNLVSIYARALGASGGFAALFIAAIVGGIFFLLAKSGTEGKSSAFMAAMVLYGVDTLLCLLLFTHMPVLAVLNLVFHGIGLAAIYKGYQALA